MSDEKKGEVHFIGTGARDPRAALAWLAAMLDEAGTQGVILTVLKANGMEQRAFGKACRYEFAQAGADLLHYASTGDFE